MDLSSFVVLMNTVMKFNSQIALVFESFKTTFNSFGAVVQLSSLLNANTCRRELLKGKERRKEAMAEWEKAGNVCTDDEILVAPGTTVQYTMIEKDHGNDLLIQAPINVSVRFPEEGLIIEQGQVLLVTSGSKHALAGKQTLLKALAQIIIPKDGFVKYSESLQVRFLPSLPQLFNLSVRENLLFGTGHASFTEEEVMELCEMMGLKRSLWERNVVKKTWGETIIGISGSRISASDRVRLCVIRTLLSGVDMLLMHNTLDLMDLQDATIVVKVLENFVKDRSVACLKSVQLRTPLALRRKKTVIVSTTNAALRNLIPSCIEL